MSYRTDEVRAVRLDRLQEYPSATFAAVCAKLSLGTITPQSMAAAAPAWKFDEHGNKSSDHLDRVKFFFDKPSDDDEDAILLSNGSPYGRPDLDEPHFYDGRHRFVAAVLRGDKTIRAMFRWPCAATVFLFRRVIVYLTGDSDIKPS
ncbi:MAG TPA: hypothetical protein VKU02_16750 [Gemmataceae bacterium]|nr:hypothetical protein [Gemmataceae bacterium]